MIPLAMFLESGTIIPEKTLPKEWQDRLEEQASKFESVTFTP
jgi:hypothetical protein